MQSKIHKGKVLTGKRLKARYLIVIEGFSQKEAAECVKVSVQSMCKWVKKYNWKYQQLNEVNKSGGLNAIMDGFFKYVENNKNSTISKEMKGLWDKYEKGLKDKFGLEKSNEGLV